MQKEITLYRVRASFRDFKSQKGVFINLTTAVITARKYGLNVYNNDGSLIFSAEESKKTDS